MTTLSPLPVEARFPTEAVTACPLCGSADVVAVCSSADSLGYSPVVFRLGRCRDCGVYYLTERCPEADVARHYGAAYPPYHTTVTAGPDAYPVSRPRLGRLVDLWHAARAGAVVGRVSRAIAGLLRGPARRRLDRRLKDLYRPPRPGAVFVDYGCGNPAALRQARADGWRTVGVDFSPDVLAAVRADGHEAVLSSDFTLAVPDGSVDLVRISHVIEHVYHPRDVLATLHAKLGPGGHLHAATPNPDALGFHLFRRNWMSVDCPRHVFLYPPRRLGRLCLETGYRRIEVHGEEAVKDLVRSVAYVEAEAGRLPRSEVVRFVEDGFWTPLLTVPAAIAALLGAAERYHLLARRD